MASTLTVPASRSRSTRGAGGKFVSRVRTKPVVVEEPPAEDVEEEETEPARMVDGQAVVDIEPIHTGLPVKPGQPRVALKGMHTLVLADGSRVVACTECEFTAEKRGTVMRHRADEHGVSLGGWATTKAGKRRSDPALQDLLGMSLGEILETAQYREQYAQYRESVDETVSALRARAEAAERQLRVITAAMEKAGFRLVLEEEA